MIYKLKQTNVRYYYNLKVEVLDYFTLINSLVINFMSNFIEFIIVKMYHKEVI